MIDTIESNQKHTSKLMKDKEEDHQKRSVRIPARSALLGSYSREKFVSLHNLHPLVYLLTPPQV
jgi:hypothetical protein